MLLAVNIAQGGMGCTRKTAFPQSTKFLMPTLFT